MSDARRGVPRQPFYWTLDQIAAMLSLTEQTLRDSYLFFDGKDVGVCRPSYLRAMRINVGRTHHSRGPGARGRDSTDWRVADGEFIRWLTYNKLWLYPEIDGVEVDPTAASYDTPRDAREAVASHPGVAADVPVTFDRTLKEQKK